MHTLEVNTGHRLPVPLEQPCRLAFGAATAVTGYTEETMVKERTA